MQHSMTVQFKKLALNKALVNVVPQAENWCGVCGSKTHDTEQCKANPNFVNYVQRGQGQQNYGNSYNPSWRNHPNFSWVGTKTKIKHKGQINTVPKGMGNNNKIPTKVYTRVYPKVG